MGTHDSPICWLACARSEVYVGGAQSLLQRLHPSLVRLRGLPRCRGAQDHSHGSALHQAAGEGRVEGAGRDG